MTDQEIKIAVAEACGWNNVRFDYANGSDTFKSWLGEKRGYVNGPPDYPTDLNATNEVVRSLSADESLNKDGFLWSDRCEFLRQLEIVVTRDTKNTDGRIQFDLVTATARQLDEAFLRTVGKWKET